MNHPAGAARSGMWRETMDTMSELTNVDRHGMEITVGAVVTYADRDELHGGTVVYIAPPEVAEIVIEGNQGLVIREGEKQDIVVEYDNLLKRS